MHESLIWVLAVAGGAGAALFFFRRKLAALARNPTPGFLRVTRAIGSVAGIVCGSAAIVLMWAGATQAGVSWLYALFGGAVLLLNLMLYVRTRPGHRR